MYYYLWYFYIFFVHSFIALNFHILGSNMLIFLFNEPVWFTFSIHYFHVNIIYPMVIAVQVFLECLNNIYDPFKINEDVELVWNIWGVCYIFIPIKYWSDDECLFKKNREHSVGVITFNNEFYHTKNVVQNFSFLVFACCVSLVFFLS